MHKPSVAAFLELASGWRGHFRLESGHHSKLWLDLDALFADPEKIMPFVSALTEALRPYNVDAVCGPLLGGAFLAQLVAHELGVQFCFTERVAPMNTNALYQTSYRLPPAFAPRVAGRRVAMVDDVMSAGSALRGTYATLQSHGATPVAAGALLALGSIGVDFFSRQGVPVEAVTREDYEMWTPSACPLCAEGIPLEDAPAG